MSDENFKDQKLRAELKAINDSLGLLSPDTIKRLEERVFVGVFLPLFAGDENLLYGQTFQTWINFAGNPYMEVHVIDVVGNVLFTVPPLLDRASVNAISKSNVSIANVVITAGQYGRIHPKQGAAYLAGELAERATILKVPANMLNYLEIWNKIFKMYGRPEIMAIEEVVNTSVLAKTSEDDFELL